MAPPSEGGKKLKAAWSRIAPGYLFLWGLVIMITFLFQKNLVIRIGESLLFIFLAVAVGKRFRLLPNLAMVLGVTLMHLLTPHGKILLSLGAFDLTRGALEAGLYRGFLLVGMVSISRCFISSRLTLPGRVGLVLGLTFVYFEELSRSAFSLRNPWASTDALLLSLWKTPPQGRCVKGEIQEFTLLWLLPPLVAALQGGVLLLMNRAA